MLKLVSVSKVSSRYGEPEPCRLTPAQRRRVLPCPFCGGREVRLGHTKDELRWALCPTCGTEFVGTRALDQDAESLLTWWSWRNGVPGVPDAVAVDSAIRYLKAAVETLVGLNPRKRYVGFTNLTPVERALATCSAALGELRGAYTGPLDERRLRVPPGARRPDQVTGREGGSR
jgi:hypothetical protein